MCMTAWSQARTSWCRHGRRMVCELRVTVASPAGSIDGHDNYAAARVTVRLPVIVKVHVVSGPVEHMSGAE